MLVKIVTALVIDREPPPHSPTLRAESPNDTPAGLAQARCGRYVVERELGRRGIVNVYLARDIKHDWPDLSSGWLKIDPLRKSPRFQKLMEGSA